MAPDSWLHGHGGLDVTLLALVLAVVATAASAAWSSTPHRRPRSMPPGPVRALTASELERWVRDRTSVPIGRPWSRATTAALISVATFKGKAPREAGSTAL